MHYRNKRKGLPIKRPLISSRLLSIYAITNYKYMPLVYKYLLQTLAVCILTLFIYKITENREKLGIITQQFSTNGSVINSYVNWYRINNPIYIDVTRIPNFDPSMVKTIVLCYYPGENNNTLLALGTLDPIAPPINTLSTTTSPSTSTLSGIFCGALLGVFMGLIIVCSNQ